MIHSVDDRRNYEIILMSVKIVIEIIVTVNLNAALDVYFVKPKLYLEIKCIYLPHSNVLWGGSIFMYIITDFGPIVYSHSSCFGGQL